MTERNWLEYIKCYGHFLFVCLFLEAGMHDTYFKNELTICICCCSDLLFGVPWKSTGITRYFIRNSQRVISFAVTVVLKKYDQK